MPGEAFNQPTDKTPARDIETFNVKSWIKGTATVTRSVEVCGRPDLMGHIEALKGRLERAQATEFDDDRPLAKTDAMRLAEEIQAAQEEMQASMVTFRFRGLKPREMEAIREEHGPDDEEGITDLDYKLWAAECIEPEGITWQDLKALHLGDDKEGINGLGAYFVNTIARTANLAGTGGGVDIPFSPASSALIATSSKS